MNTGTVVQVIGPVIDVRFPDEIPAIYNALTVGIDSGDGQSRQVVCEVQQHLGDDKVRAVAMDATDGLARGIDVIDTGVAMTVPVGEQTLGRLINVTGDTIDQGEPLVDVERWPIHRAGSRLRGLSTPQTRSSRPASRSSTSSPRTPRAARSASSAAPASARPSSSWSSSATSPPSTAATRVFAGVGERTPRGQRPVARDEGVGRHRQDRPRLRPDERAAGSAPARRPVRPHHGRVLPRRGRPGRAALHRQHLPFRAGGLRGLGPARAHAERRGLPAHPGQRDGRAAGAHHLHQARLDHLGAGHLRARRRPHRPGAGDHLRPPRRHHGALARRSSRRASTRPSTRSTRPRASSTRDVVGEEHYAGGARASRRSCSATRSCRTSSPSSAWTSSPTRTSSSCTARAQDPALPLAALLRRRAVHRHARASTSRSTDTMRGFKEIVDGKCDDLPEQAFFMVGGIEEAAEQARQLAGRDAAG